jgi:C-terminal processing protease CtpA/Prc
MVGGDIRHNFGGETRAFQPVLHILSSPRATLGRRLIVITGRNTFSAASLFTARLERATPALFVGEPMGGSPNLYGNSRDVTLPFSGIDVRVATQYLVGSTRDDTRLTIQPDIRVELTSTDYFGGRDPVLAAALAACNGASCHPPRSANR